MTDARSDLQKQLEKCADRVYYRPAEHASLQYPCITYLRRYADQKQANNKTYHVEIAYWVTVIDVDGENDIQKKLLNEFTKIRWQNEFVSNGLNHSVFLLYYKI